jgi:carbonic anhydrase
MQKLIQGIHDFQSQLFGSQREFFEGLAKGQHPLVLFITCADSRIVPNLITQTDPGDLFILRNAGNLVPPHGGGGGEAATIEFGVAGMGIRDIIVCGHSHCGAMEALLAPERLAGLPEMARWLRHAEATRRIVRDNYPHVEGRALATLTVEENVLVQIENLRTHPAVASALARGRVRLHGWVYKIETGEMFAYDAREGQFVPLSALALLDLPLPARRTQGPSV